MTPTLTPAGEATPGPSSRPAPQVGTADKFFGQLAYEADVEARPVYHDGAPRKTWGQLDDVARWSWSRIPKALAREANHGL